MKINSKAFLISFLAPVLLTLLLVSRSKEIVPGVTAVRLVGGCQVELYDTSAQPVFTVAFSCPGVDTIRLWPLPVLQDWQEKPDPIPGLVGACQPDNWSKTGTKVNVLYVWSQEEASEAFLEALTRSWYE